MKTSMLEYCKLILSKVWFDKKLFWKEYRKSYRFLSKEEFALLTDWVRSEYFSAGKQPLVLSSHAA